MKYFKICTEAIVLCCTTLLQKGTSNLPSKADHRLIESLIKAGVDVNSVDSEGNTLLHLIFRSYSQFQFSFNRTAEVILDRGIDVNKMNYAGFTPLMAAMQAKEKKPLSEAVIINHLYAGRSGRVAFKFDFENGVTGDNLLHYAARIPSIDSIAQLLESGELSAITLNNSLLTPQSYVPISHRTSRKLLYIQERTKVLNLLAKVDEDFSFEEDIKNAANQISLNRGGAKLIQRRASISIGKSASNSDRSATGYSISGSSTILKSVSNHPVNINFERKSNNQKAGVPIGKIRLSLRKPSLGSNLSASPVDMTTNQMSQRAKLLRAQKSFGKSENNEKIGQIINDLAKLAAKVIAMLRVNTTESLKDSFVSSADKNSQVGLADSISEGSHMGERMVHYLLPSKNQIEDTPIANCIAQQKRALMSLGKKKTDITSSLRDPTIDRLCKLYINLLLKMTVRILNSDKIALSKCSISLLISAIIMLNQDRLSLKKLLTGCNIKQSSLFLTRNHVRQPLTDP